MLLAPRVRSALALALLLLPIRAARSEAQSLAGHLMGQAIPSVIDATPVPGGGDLSEVRVLQPVVMGAAGLGQGLRGRLTLNFERWTLADGELAPGGWGEGFVDRRHPHTTLHEAMLWGVLSAGGGSAASLAVGKGFVPFGTDDPMSRPFVRYPVNHHLAQILERAEIAGGVRVKGVALEASLFNGDEPESPSQWPNLSRFGDSWSLRLTLLPVSGLEVQGSYADVASPEHRPGSGLDHAKWSASARFERPVGRLPVYALVEWARTAEGQDAFVFSSVLAEAALNAGRHRFGYRFERTTRPEEERLFDDLFRSPRPHLDDNIVGITRWVLHTLHYEARFAPVRPLGLAPFVELTVGTVQDRAQGVFVARDFYGTSDVRSLTLGLRVDLGGAMPRMGRYGVMVEPIHQSAAVGGHSH